MRIAHIITRLVVGGAQENTVSTVMGLRAKSGVHINLISGPSTGPEGSMEHSVASVPDILIRIPCLIRPVHPLKDLLALRQLQRMLGGLRPQVVHTHSGKAGILGRIAAHRVKVPVIIHHIHGPSFGPFQGGLANILFTNAERFAGKLTTHFITSAQAMARLYLEAGIGKPEMYTRVFSGFDTHAFLEASNDLALRRKLGFGQDDFIIGKIARLAPLKGHMDLLEAAALVQERLPNARLLLLGDGSLRKSLERQIQVKGLSARVVFTGLVPPQDVPKFVGIMDCLVHLSYREALSRALPQAMAAGKPVLSYDFDGADEVCINGETGFLVKRGDVASVAAGLSRLAAESDLRRRLGETGRTFVRDRFRIDKMVEEQYQIYVRLLKEHPFCA